MQESFIATGTCLDEQDVEHTFRYFLLSEQIPTDRFDYEIYGIKIEEVNGNSALACNITCSYTKAMELVHLFSRCEVTPSNLPEVLEDMELPTCTASAPILRSGLAPTS